jgi:hypothetical protein
MNNSILPSVSFDPCKIFPARIRARKFEAKPISAADRARGAGGATDLVKGKAYLPVANSAMARTIRTHEALHAIYTPKPTKERIKSGKPFTMLEQGVEDARLHLCCAKLTGVARRDELAVALRDLRGAAKRDSPVTPLIALRSMAMLASQTNDFLPEVKSAATKLVDAVCAKVAPDYHEAVIDALNHLHWKRQAEASERLAPYFPAEDETSLEIAFPLMLAGEPKEDGPKGDIEGFEFEKVEGKLSSEAAEMLSDSTAKMVRDGSMPQLYIHPMFASAMIPTFFGEDAKHMMSGTKIHAKKLATIVGPIAPRIFLKTIRRNGGSILIDASGSMNLTPEKLFSLVQKAPAATIAFYNAPSDSSMYGNMWIYSHKGKRAADFSTIKRVHGEKGINFWGYGNVVDFQALQWLIAQDGPRYVMTDGKVTGPYCTQQAALELLHTAIARKKVKQVTSLKEMEDILAKRGGMQ